MSEISRRSALTGLATAPLIGASLVVAKRKLSDRLGREKLERFGLEEHADLEVEDDVELLAIDPDTGKSVKIG